MALRYQITGPPGGRIFAIACGLVGLIMTGTRFYERVSTALEELRPALRMDGGDIELIAVSETGVVEVRLLGACCGCPMAEATLVGFIQERLKNRVPQVSQVVHV